MKKRDKIYQKYGGRCGYCGDQIKIKDMQIDHIIPKSNFRPFVMNNFKVPRFLAHLTVNDLHHKDNLMPACRSCNRFKDSFDIEEFRNELRLQLDRANKYSRNYRLARKWGQVQETPKEIVFYFEKIIE